MRTTKPWMQWRGGTPGLSILTMEEVEEMWITLPPLVEQFNSGLVPADDVHPMIRGLCMIAVSIYGRP